MGTKPLLLVVLLLLALNLVLASLWYTKRSRPPSSSRFACPVPPNYCARGRVLEVEGYYLGVGYLLPPGTPILALFSGQTSGARVTYNPRLGGGHYPAITIRQQDGELSATYVLTGPDYQGLATVLWGEAFAQAREGTIANLGVNLLVRVSQGNQPLRLGPGDFTASQ